jgi:hypothetical protein
MNRDAIVLTAEDTGPGIDPSKAGVVFDAFVTTKPRGTGSGICRMIVERRKGEISVAPVDPHGSSFSRDPAYRIRGAIGRRSVPYRGSALADGRLRKKILGRSSTQQNLPLEF